MELRTAIEDIVREADVNLDDLETALLLDHLLSKAIGVVKLSDLDDVQIKTLPPNLLGEIPAKRLIKFFHKAAKAAICSRSRSRSPIRRPRNESDSESGASQHEGDNIPEKLPVFGEGEFRYLINWNDMPRKTVRALETAKQNKTEADDDEINKLKRALADKIVIAYKDFQKTHPHITQKTPGLKVSFDVAIQVVKKFEIAMQESLNGKVHGDGTLTFRKRLNTKIENMFRKIEEEDGGIPSVNRGVGVPGVLKDQYRPPISRKSRNRQTLIRGSLCRINKEEDPDDWDWTDIGTKMKDTYELQRDDIVELTKKVMDEADGEDESSDDPDEDERAMPSLKRDWPFLFYSVPMNTHYKRLTGIDLQERVMTFLSKDELKYLLLYFCSCCNTSAINTQNLVLKLKVQQEMPASASMSTSTQFLLAMCMTANNFAETYTNTFLFTSEKTLRPEEVDSVPNLPSSICIIALGDDPFNANMYYVSLDKICVAEKENALDAVMMLIKICFVFDIEYPPGLSLTFEFIERIVLELTVKRQE